MYIQCDTNEYKIYLQIPSESIQGELDMTIIIILAQM